MDFRYFCNRLGMSTSSSQHGVSLWQVLRGCVTRNPLVGSSGTSDLFITDVTLFEKSLVKSEGKTEYS